jgi:hypothetical protein
MSAHVDEKKEGAPRQESTSNNKAEVTLAQNTLERRQISAAVGDSLLERAVIGSLLFSPAVMLPIMKEVRLEPPQFLTPMFPEIFGRVLQAERESETMEPMNMSSYLAKKGIPFQILSDLQTGNGNTLAPTIFRHWCEQIKEAAAGRAAAALLQQASDRLRMGERLEIVFAEVEESLKATKRQLGPMKTRETQIQEQFECSSIRSTQLSEVALPPRRPVVGDWLYEADLLFIFARRGLGKTWLSLALACAIASKNKFGPYPVHTNLPVLYVDGEMPFEIIQRRITALGASDELAVINHEVMFHQTGAALNLTDPLVQSKLTQHCLKNSFKLLVLDNLSCLFSGVKENDADSWEAVLPWLLDLRRKHIAVLIVAHSGRDGKSMRGTSRREDAAFSVIRLDEVPDDGEQRCGARFVMRFTKNRNSATDLGATDWTFQTQTDGSVEISNKQAEGSAVMLQWVRDGLTSCSEIAEEMGLSKGTVSKMGTKLIELGRLKMNGRQYTLP